VFIEEKEKVAGDVEERERVLMKKELIEVL
jgi:hypothetical protein